MQLDLGKILFCFGDPSSVSFVPCFFVKLDFEIAVDQQTKAHNRTFEVIPDFGCPPVPAGQPRLIWSIFGSILSYHLNMLKTEFGHNFFKGLTQYSTPKLKVEIQFYVDPENFMKKY